MAGNQEEYIVKVFHGPMEAFSFSNNFAMSVQEVRKMGVNAEIYLKIPETDIGERIAFISDGQLFLEGRAEIPCEEKENLLN